MAGRKSQTIKFPVELDFSANLNAVQKALSSIRAGASGAKSSTKLNIFGDIDKQAKTVESTLNKLLNFKMNTGNVNDFGQLLHSLESQWADLITVQNQAKNQLGTMFEDPVRDLEKLNAKLAELPKSAQGIDFDKLTKGGKVNKGENKGKTKMHYDGGAKYFSDDELSQYKDYLALKQQEIDLENRIKAQAEIRDQVAKATEQNKVVQDELNESLGKGVKRLEHGTEVSNDFNESLRRSEIADKIKHWTSWGFAINIVQNALRKMIDTYQEVDKSITAISMVSGISRDDLWQDIGEYNDLAKEFGTTTTEVLNASKIFYQQGLATADVMTLTKESLTLAAIAETDTAKATDYLTTAINGFKLAASEASMVTDTWAELAGKTAVDVDDLAVGISKVASIAQSAGMELQSTSAFLTQIIDTTREAPETAGTALKTIIARFQELKKSGASLEDGVDANKVEAALKTADVALRDASGQFRNFDDVILELSSKWDGLDRNTQRYIATIAAGSRQQSRFIALVDDYDGLLENVGYAYDSAGAATLQFNTYSEGLQASLQRLEASWQDVWLSFSKGETIISGAIDTIAKFLDIIASIPANWGIIGVGALAIGVKTLVSFTGHLLTATNAVGDWNAAWAETTKPLKNAIKAIQALIFGEETATAVTTKATAAKSAKAWAELANETATKKSNAAISKNTRELLSNKIATSNLTKEEKEQAIQILANAASYSQLNQELDEVIANKLQLAGIDSLDNADDIADAAKGVKGLGTSFKEAAKNGTGMVGLLTKGLSKVGAATASTLGIAEISGAGMIALGVGVTAVILGVVAGIYLLATAEKRRLKRLKETAQESAKVAQSARQLADAYTDFNERLKNVATGEEDLESIRKDLIAQFGPYYKGINLLTAGYTKLQEAMSAAQEEQERLALAAEIDAAQDKQASDYETARTDWLKSDEATRYIDQARTYFENRGITEEKTIVDHGDYQEERVVNSGYEYNGVYYSDAYVAAEAMAQDYARGYAESLHGSKTEITRAQAELLAEGTEGWAERAEEEKERIIQALQSGWITTDTIKGKDAEGNEIVKGIEFKEEELTAFNDFQEQLAEQSVEFQAAVSDLMSGAITWNDFIELDEGYAEALTAMGTFGSEMAQEFAAGAARERADFNAMLESAGFYQNDAGAYGDKNSPYEESIGTRILNELGWGDDNLDLKTSFLTAFNALANDPEAQQAYAEAVQGLIDNVDIELLTPEMIETLGSQEEAGKAFANLLSMETLSDEQKVYLESLRIALDDVTEGAIETEHAISKIGSTLASINDLTESMSFDEFIGKTTEMGLALEQSGFAAEGMGEAMWLSAMEVDANTGEVSINKDMQLLMAEAQLQSAIMTAEDSLQKAINRRETLALQLANLGLIQGEYGVATALEDVGNKGVDGADIWDVYWKAANGEISQEEAEQMLKNMGTSLKEVGDVVAQAATSFTGSDQQVWKDYQQVLVDEAKLRLSVENLRKLKAADLLKGKNKGGGSGGKSELERQRELLDKQKEILEAEGDAQEKRIKLIQEELKARKDALKEEQEALKDAFEQQQEQWEIRLEYVRDTLEAERDALEEAADAAEDAAQKEIDAAKRAAEGKINLIQMQIDAMDEEAEAEDRLLKLQKARDEYERARTSKTRLVLTKGAGWIFKTDNAQVEDAAANLKDVERDYQKSLLEAQIAEIEKVVESMEDVEGLLGMTADEIAAMNEATKKWSDYIINGTFADEVATQIGTSIVDPETGVKQTDVAGIAQAAVDASQAVADWAEKFEPVLEALEAAIEKIGTSMEDMLLNAEAEEKELDDFFNQIVGAGGTNEILSALDGTMVEVEASQREMAEKSASIDETIKKIDEDLEAWDEQLDLIGLSSSEIAETQKQVAEYQAATLEELGVHGKYYEEIAATLKDLAAKWEQYNIADRNLQAQEDAEKGYSSGGVASFTGRAKLHGSTSRPEVVLNNSQAAALFHWVNGLGSNRYDTIFDSLGQQVNLLEHQMRLLNAGTALVSAGHGDTYNFGTVNIDSDANSIEQLVTDIRRLSPLTQHR